MRVKVSVVVAHLCLACIFVVGVCGDTSAAEAADGQSPGRLLYLVDTAGLGSAEIEALKVSGQIDLWLEMGHELAVIGPAGLRERLASAGLPFRLVDGDFDSRMYRVIASRDPDSAKQAEPLVRTIAGAGGIRLVRVTDGNEPALAALESFRFRVHEFPSESLVLHGRYRTATEGEAAATWDPKIQEVVDALDATFVAGRTDALTRIRSRYSPSANFVNATNYVVAEYAGLGLATVLDPFVVQGNTVNNVVAEIPGLLHPDDVYILGAHYDSYQEYPGADDNASGTATTLALAKVFTQKPPLSTIRFVNFAAEEQGLIGSAHYVADLLAQRDHDKILGVVTMDMIAYENRTDGKIDVLLEGRSRLSQRLIEDLAQSATDYTTLEPAFVSYNPFGSDHMSFINRNIPALLTIENEDGANPYYHSAQDTYATLNGNLHREISKMNLATLAKMAGTRDIGDAVAPGAVAALSVVGATHSAITVEWTASGDDGAVGKASAYDVRYASTPILDDADFANASTAEREPKPSPAGMPERFTLMGLAAGTRYCLSVKAIDDNLNASALPPGPLCATTDPVSVSFSDDMEAGVGGWTNDAAWHRDAYRNSTPGGAYSWKCGGTGSAHYANNLNASLVSQYVTLGPGSILQFWHRMLAKETNDTQSADGGIVEIQPAGSAVWTQIAPAGGYNYSSSGGPFPTGTPLFAGNIPWKEAAFDLSAFSGDVRFRLRFGSDGSSTWEGWYVDDVTVVSQTVPVEVPRGSKGEPPLLLSRAGADLHFSWGPVAGADFYNLYRGSIGSLAAGSYDHACLQGEIATQTVTRADESGDHYFLVAAQNHAGEGPAGRDSAGTVIAIDEGDRCVP